MQTGSQSGIDPGTYSQSIVTSLGIVRVKARHARPFIGLIPTNTGAFEDPSCRPSRLISTFDGSHRCSEYVIGMLCTAMTVSKIGMTVSRLPRQPCPRAQTSPRRPNMPNDYFGQSGALTSADSGDSFNAGQRRPRHACAVRRPSRHPCASPADPDCGAEQSEASTNSAPPRAWPPSPAARP